jgi:hypothetical protein
MVDFVNSCAAASNACDDFIGSERWGGRCGAQTHLHPLLATLKQWLVQIFLHKTFQNCGSSQLGGSKIAAEVTLLHLAQWQFDKSEVVDL